MYAFFSVMVIICAVLLVLIVLIQNSKGGGLASNFSQGNQIMGVKKTTDFLEKATWYLVAGLIIFCLLASFTIPKKSVRTTPTQTEMPASTNQEAQTEIPAPTN